MKAKVKVDKPIFVVYFGKGPGTGKYNNYVYLNAVKPKLDKQE